MIRNSLAAYPYRSASRTRPNPFCPV